MTENEIMATVFSSVDIVLIVTEITPQPKIRAVNDTVCNALDFRVFFIICVGI